MSRVAKQVIVLPTGVQAQIATDKVAVKGAKSQLEIKVPAGLKVVADGQKLHIERTSQSVSTAMAGTLRANINNLVNGVTKGFTKKLELVGVGYRAQAQGKSLNLTLGYSHPVNYAVPEGISIETPSQTEIIVKGASKHLVGQVAADIRGFRPPEPYKGKGVKYVGENILRKEAKKK